jgi:hypothetical protein
MIEINNVLYDSEQAFIAALNRERLSDDEYEELCNCFPLEVARARYIRGEGPAP